MPSERVVGWPLSINDWAADVIYHLAVFRQTWPLSRNSCTRVFAISMKVPVIFRFRRVIINVKVREIRYDSLIWLENRLDGAKFEEITQENCFIQDCDVKFIQSSGEYCRLILKQCVSRIIVWRGRPDFASTNRKLGQYHRKLELICMNERSSFLRRSKSLLT